MALEHFRSRLLENFACYAPRIGRYSDSRASSFKQVVEQAGYKTACVGKWHLGGRGFGPKEQGFDLYHPGRANTEPSATECTGSLCSPSTSEMMPQNWLPGKP